MIAYRIRIDLSSHLEIGHWGCATRSLPEPRSSSTLPADGTVLLRGALMSIPDLSFCCNLALNFPLSTSCRTSGEAFAERLPGAANGSMQQHHDDDFIY